MFLTLWIHHVTYIVLWCVAFWLNQGFPGARNNRMTLNPAFPSGLGFIRDVDNSVVGSSETTLSEGQSGGPIFSARDRGGPAISSSSCIYAVIQGSDSVNAYRWERQQLSPSIVFLATLLNTLTVQKIVANVDGVSLCPEVIPCGGGAKGNEQCPATDMMDIDPSGRLLQQVGQCCDTDGECKDSCENCVRTNQQCGGQNYAGPTRCCKSDESCTSSPSPGDPSNQTCQTRKRNNNPNFPDPDPTPGGLCCPLGFVFPIPPLPSIGGVVAGAGVVGGLPVFLPPSPSCRDDEISCGNRCCAAGDICYGVGPTNQACGPPNIFPAPDPSPAPASRAPPTSAPVSRAPVTSAPVSQAPVTSAPVSQAPVASAPVSQAPVSSEPSQAPSRDCLANGVVCFNTFPPDPCCGRCRDAIPPFGGVCTACLGRGTACSLVIGADPCCSGFCIGPLFIGVCT
jgi:hypothetical protein